MKDIPEIAVIIFLSVFLFISLFFESAVYANSDLSPKDKKKIFSMIDEEFSFVKEILNFLEKEKDAAWFPGDFEFYDSWLNGLEKEKKGRFADAIRFYKKGYKVERFEMLSYEILLPLGRAYILNNEQDKAMVALKEFLTDAENDLSNMGPWDFTEESRQNLLKDMERAKWLINLLDKND